MKRYLAAQATKDLQKKMVFIGGPRQAGKTTLSIQLLGEASYLNWDNAEDRQNILTHQLPAGPSIIFDEIHKYKSWRSYLKGYFDKNRHSRKILVTGSARLDLLRRGGDSLQGRYHYLRLHPLSIDELKTKSQTDWDALFNLGGFPEPFLSGSRIDAQRWSREYRQRLLQDDILPIRRIEDTGNAELLLLRLPDLVAGPLSINSLREDLQVSHKAVDRWLDIFENFYAIFRLLPFGSPKIKAVKKERKHYHFDWTLVKSEGARFENMVASHLLKACHFIEDTEGRDIELRFMRDLEQKEVDFVIIEDKKPICFIECKFSEHTISKDLLFIKKKFLNVPCFQLLHNTKHDFISKEGIRVGPAAKLIFEVFEIIAKQRG